MAYSGNLYWDEKRIERMNKGLRFIVMHSCVYVVSYGGV